MSFKPLLAKLADLGKPLVEVVVDVDTSVDPEEVCRTLDQIAPDIGATIQPAFYQPTGHPDLFELRMDATKEALEREFGWQLSRDPYIEDCYSWEEQNKPQFFPPNLNGKIRQMGLTQPGTSDNGYDDKVSYDIQTGHIEVRE